MKKSVTMLSIVLFAACSSKVLLPTQADVDRVSGRYPGYTLASLNEGKAIYEEHCGMCHGLKDPQSRSEEKWKAVAPDMSARVNKKIGQEVITAGKQEIMLRYLLTMSSAKAK